METITRLVELAAQLQELEEFVQPGMKYKHSKEIRGLCQDMKVAAQELRVEVNELRKK